MDPGRLPAVQAVLDARMAALGAGDRGAWLATVDPAAPAAFRDAQGRLFDGLRSVPLDVYRLEARLDDSGDLSAGLGQRYGAPVFLPETRQRTRLRGFDDRDAVDSLWWTFVEREGRWFVGGDDDLAPLGLDTTRGLWDFGPVQVAATEHFLVLFHPEQAERGRALAAMAEEAMRTLTDRSDLPWSERIPIVVPGSVTELERILQSTIDLDKFLAFVAYGAVRDAGWEPTAPRMYVQDQNLSGYGREFQVETLVHELVHAAGAPSSGPFIPAWVHEGLADWVATGQATRERKPSGSDGRLPRDYEFSTGDRGDIIRAYRESRSATSFLAARSGRPAPETLFSALGETRSAPGSVDFHVDAALRRSTGIALVDFERGWAAR